MKASIQDIYTQVIDAIRNSGNRVTSVRQKIILLLLKSRKPVSIQEVALLTEIDEVSVYRTIAFLKELGFVEEIMVRDGVRRFSFASEHHHHILCIKCSHVVHVPCSGFSVSSATQHPDFASISEHSVTYYGVCTECAQ